MNPVYIYFSKVLNAPSEDFIAKVINGLVQFYHKEGGTNNFSDNDIVALSQDISKHINDKKLPVIDVDNHKEVVSGRWETRRNQSINCADDIINGVMGNDPGQHSYSCLKEDWNGFEKGVVVATRQEVRDGQSILTYFIFPNTVITEDGKMGQTHPRFPYEKEELVKNNAIVQTLTLLQQEPLDSLLV